MDLQDVHFRMPVPMLNAAQHLAREADITVGQLLRLALEAEIARRTRAAKTPNRADERLLASLRSLLAIDLAAARSWGELSGRLARKGFALREAGGGLALHSHPEGQRLCKASELGFAYGSLMQRFGKPFPGQCHVRAGERVPGPLSKHGSADLIGDV
ncbi:relaxase family protein [Thiosulfatihalobacter marinus]|uniref:hypothetical protein n=1 Tax=Thiosulfatihalobacter marinus TaxID=2792481 RepID=UPI0018D80AC3|nr:hypothetical protein [Thiosulfatihalobacter marinus]